MIRVEYEEAERPIKRILIDCEELPKDNLLMTISSDNTQLIFKGHVVIKIATARAMIGKIEELIKQAEEKTKDK